MSEEASSSEGTSSTSPSARPTTDARQSVQDGITGPSRQGIPYSELLMSGVLKVDADEIDTLATVLGRKLAEKNGFNDLLNQLQSDMDDLDRDWVGPNHDRFMAYFTERYERVAAYGEWLDGYVEALKKAATLYKELPGKMRQYLQG